jgi:hypothetical protein
MHPEASVHHLDCMRSDHRPILLETDNLMLVNNPGKSKKFEARWLQEDTFRGAVEQAWARAGDAVAEGGVHARLEHMHSSLHAWNNEVLKKPKKENSPA